MSPRLMLISFSSVTNDGIAGFGDVKRFVPTDRISQIRDVTPEFATTIELPRSIWPDATVPGIATKILSEV